MRYRSIYQLLGGLLKEQVWNIFAKLLLGVFFSDLTKNRRKESFIELYGFFAKFRSTLEYFESGTDFGWNTHFPLGWSILKGELLVSFIACSTAVLFGCLNNNHFVSLCKLAENRLHHFQMMFSSPTDPLLGGSSHVVSG